MLKKSSVLFLIIIFQIIFVSILCAQDKSTKPDFTENSKQKIRGKITEIAEDETYIKIGEKKIITSKQFLNDFFITVGDNVEIMVEEIPEGVKALDSKYICDESNDSSVLDEDSVKQGEFDLDISGE